MAIQLKVRNESGTKHARIADSQPVWIRSRRYVETTRARPTRWGVGSANFRHFGATEVNADRESVRRERVKRVTLFGATWRTRALATDWRRTASPSSPQRRPVTGLRRGSARGRACRRSAQTRSRYP